MMRVIRNDRSVCVLIDFDRFNDYQTCATGSMIYLLRFRKFHRSYHTYLKIQHIDKGGHLTNSESLIMDKTMLFNTLCNWRSGRDSGSDWGLYRHKAFSVEGVGILDLECDEYLPYQLTDDSSAEEPIW